MTRIILTDDERDLLRMIDHVKLELKLSKEVNNSVSTDRVFDLLNLKSMLLNSLLARTRQQCDHKILSVK